MLAADSSWPMACRARHRVAGLTAVVTFRPRRVHRRAVARRPGRAARRLTFALPLVLLLGGVVRLLYVTVPAARLAVTLP
jgi:hypothetical protein